ncbi:peptidoglycan editing factor PgeF [Clostridium sp. WILCCON 0269]|uniref:Purine nucleoside phosphorylase n=1 Tax=Candidatus Clostridium eludens TaxID=3381663 RepID=A0ABW8SKY5_9CLOT
MERILVEGYEFIKIDLKGAEAVFSTAKNNLNFNKSEDIGRKNIENLKKWFNLRNIGYLNQVHGCDSIIYRGRLEDADGIITNMPYEAVGVFNADCVPIILYDRKEKVVAAVHSGWRGTLGCIVLKTLEKLQRDFKSDPLNITACIGPHICNSCYEVGEEVIHEFKNSPFYRDKKIFEGRKLSLKKCILHQLQSKGVKYENINCLDVCTACNTEYELYSYRKNKYGGRLFSFVYLNPSVN